MNPRLVISVAAILGSAGVGLGAYHAHGFEDQLQRAGTTQDDAAKRLDQCAMGVRYQMYHALALLAVGLLSLHNRSSCLTAAAACLVLGVLLFSGGLYLMAFADHIGHWAIVPGGGVLLIAGWLALATHACCCWPAASPTTSGPG